VGHDLKDICQFIFEMLTCKNNSTIYGDYVTLKLSEMGKRVENACIFWYKKLEDASNVMCIKIATKLYNYFLLQSRVNNWKNNFRVKIMASDCVGLQKQYFKDFRKIGSFTKNMI